MTVLEYCIGCSHDAELDPLWGFCENCSPRVVCTECGHWFLPPDKEQWRTRCSRCRTITPRVRDMYTEAVRERRDREGYCCMCGTYANAGPRTRWRFCSAHRVYAQRVRRRVLDGQDKEDAIMAVRRQYMRDQRT